MKMHLENSERNLITDYGPDGIRVNRELHTNTIIVGADCVLDGSLFPDIDALEPDAFSEALALKPEIIVLGTGTTHRFPHPRLAAELSAQGCALEVMSTSAACRTYNVLVSEFRDVVGVLLPIK